jgi:hypothetical protein
MAQMVHHRSSNPSTTKKKKKKELINAKVGLICVFAAFQMWDKQIPVCIRLYHVLENMLTNSFDHKLGAKGYFQDGSNNKSNLCLNAA